VVHNMILGYAPYMIRKQAKGKTREAAGKSGK
jgi:hypothetical protein